MSKAHYIHKGLFEVKTTIVDDTVRPRTYMTPKGIEYFAQRLGQAQTA